MTFTRRAFTASLFAAPALLRGARAALPSLPNIAAADASLAVPGSALYDSTLPAYNLRTELKPALRILTKTPRGMSQALDWVRTKDLPFALRSGGHCFEGFSQSTSVVIDTRLMKSIDFDANSGSLTVGAGASLGDIYHAVAPRGFGFPGGSCPTVGVSGHTMGGGFGLLARERGLACDALAAIDLVDAGGKTVHADAQQNAELFWAVRGGGGGTFGAATALRFKLMPIGPLQVYSMSWALPLQQAIGLFQYWQDWAPRAPDSITGIFKVSKRSDGRIALHVAGQSTGPAVELKRELKRLADEFQPSSGPSVTAMSYMAAVNHFAGTWNYESQYSKGKSDYITRPLDTNGIEVLLDGLMALPANEIIAICDAYGGAIDRIADDATAFAYRKGTEFCIQYYTSWGSAAAGQRRMADMRKLYGAMRPYSGGSYVNYCDLDLADWRQAYWRQNLTRLRAAKARFDPQNVFHHAQSVS